MVARQIEIVRLLADGELHSGEVLARQLGISRAGVWKALRKACEALGLELDAQRGQGYRLRRPLELLDGSRIRALLPPGAADRIRELTVLDDVDSSNSWLLRRAEANADAPSGAVCLAERQSAGRGRQGRAWVSPFGTNLYLSLLWRFPLAPAQLGGLSLAAGVAVARALIGAGAAGVGLKWPNDLHVRRRKLGGLLLEVAGESQGPSRVVVGVGINLRLEAAQAAAIDQPWTDLATLVSEPAGAGGVLPGRNALAAALIAGLSEAMAGYAAEGLAPFLAPWRTLDVYLGEPVTLLVGGEEIQGLHAGIDDDGALLLETAGGLRRFQAGEVSLRSRLDRCGPAGSARG